MQPSLDHLSTQNATVPVSEASFTNIYVSHFGQVKAFLARAGCDAHSIDDLTQETFLRAWSGRMRFSGRVHVRTWLLAIARNAARESWRKRKKAHLLEDGRSSHTAATPMDDVEAHRALHLAIRDLPPKQRVAITLVYLDGVTQSDAALKVNCAAAAFRRRLACGRSRLRRLLNTDDLV